MIAKKDEKTGNKIQTFSRGGGFLDDHNIYREQKQTYLSCTYICSECHITQGNDFKDYEKRNEDWREKQRKQSNKGKEENRLKVLIAY